MATESSEGADPLELYDELCMSGNPPDPEKFAAQHPGSPGLLKRIRALDALRQDLDDLARDIGGADSPPRAEIGGFRVIEPLGRGGMGDVFLAEQQRPHRLCALKLLRHGSPIARQRFEREAELASGLSHPSIAQVYAYGFDSGQAYIATEYIEGVRLSLIIKARGCEGDLPLREGATEQMVDALNSPLTTERSVCIALAVSEALAHAHGHGVIHRDVKPSNVMVTSGDAIKLIDFGIALPWHAQDRITQTGVFVGSQKYAAPEQLLGLKAEIGPWTDTYALGVTLFQMLTGIVPFATPDEMADRRKRGPRRGPRSFNRDVSRSLNALVLRALSPKLAKRFCDGEQMAEALRKCH